MSPADRREAVGAPEGRLRALGAGLLLDEFVGKLRQEYESIDSEEFNEDKSICLLAKGLQRTLHSTWPFRALGGAQPFRELAAARCSFLPSQSKHIHSGDEALLCVAVLGSPGFES